MPAKPLITRMPCPNYGYPAGTHGRHGHKVVAIVHHIMQGTLAGTDSWFASPKSGASTHFGVGKDGTIHQYVDLADAAWGNGLMQKPDLTIPWLKECWDKNVNPNLMTVSIEFEGAHSTNPNGSIKSPDWAPTEAQITAAVALDRWLCAEFGIVPGPHTLIGHFQIDGVNRPYCPGPQFPWDRMRAEVGSAPAEAPKPGAIRPVPINLLNGETVMGELRGQTTWMPVGDTWLPVRVVAKALGATVEATGFEGDFSRARVTIHPGTNERS